MEPTLIMFSGLAGTGKTTLARQVAYRLRIPMVSFDHFVDHGLPRHLWSVEEFGQDDLWHILFSFADLQLSLGLSVILDAVFMGEGRVTARGLAARHGARFCPVHTYCSDEAVWRRRVVQRMAAAAPDEAPASWEGIQSFRDHFQEWSPGSALFVDAIDPVETNLARVLEYVCGTRPC